MRTFFFFFLLALPPSSLNTKLKPAQVCLLHACVAKSRVDCYFDMGVYGKPGGNLEDLIYIQASLSLPSFVTLIRF